MTQASDILTVTGDFDGGNPKDASRIRRDGSGVFTVTPTWEKPPTHILGLAFAVKVRNASKRPASVTVNVDWATTMHIQYKSSYYVNREYDEEWQEVAASMSGTVATVSFEAAPGESRLSLQPMYSYADSLAFADALSEREDVEVTLAGSSRQGREIWRVQIPADPEPMAEPVFFLARNNACETSGNFMIEGMVRFLLSGSAEAKDLLKNFVFHFLPMSNPDGAFDGLERETAVKGGAWLGRLKTAKDPAHDVIRRSLEIACPAVFVNLHNWMIGDVDGLLCNEERYARRLAELLPPVGKFPHRRHLEWYSDAVDAVQENVGVTIWPVSKLEELHRESGGTWKDFCRERFGSRAMAIEIPWRGRTAADMRRLGAMLLKSVCTIRTEERLVPSPTDGETRT